MLSLLLLASTRPLLNGVDASFVPQYRDLKAKFTVDGRPTDALDALAESGNKLLRLRVWVNPKDGYCSVARTLEMAKEAKRLGMKTLIDFHYADSWADPQQQPTPAAWRSYDLPKLEEAVRQHTSRPSTNSPRRAPQPTRSRSETRYATACSGRSVVGQLQGSTTSRRCSKRGSRAHANRAEGRPCV